MSVPLSTDQFQSKKRAIRTLPTRNVRLDHLMPSQNNYISDKVEKIAQQDPSSFDVVPLVGMLGGGKYEVIDGHHRVAGAILRGDRTMSVRIAR